LLQILLTIFFSSFKFAATFPLVIGQFKFSFAESILWTNVGGVAGIFFFAFLSEKLLRWWKQLFHSSKQNMLKKKPRKKKLFTKRNRRIVRIKQQYGLIGIAGLTPFLLSIPVGVFLAVRYYHSSRMKFLYLIISNLVWSVIYTLFYMFWAGLLLNRS
jgi:hypothetical protein